MLIHTNMSRTSNILCGHEGCIWQYGMLLYNLYGDLAIRCYFILHFDVFGVTDNDVIDIYISKAQYCMHVYMEIKFSQH
jgi:hypothetical protein